MKQKIQSHIHVDCLYYVKSGPGGNIREFNGTHNSTAIMQSNAYAMLKGNTTNNIDKEALPESIYIICFAWEATN